MHLLFPKLCHVHCILVLDVYSFVVLSCTPLAHYIKPRLYGEVCSYDHQYCQHVWEQEPRYSTMGMPFMKSYKQQTFHNHTSSKKKVATIQISVTEQESVNRSGGEGIVLHGIQM